MIKAFIGIFLFFITLTSSSVSFAIRDGKEGGYAGTVELIFESGPGCTGTLIGQSMILTAAHCGPQTSRTTGEFDVFISYAISGTDWICLNDYREDSQGKCETMATASYSKRKYDGEARTDMMVITPSVNEKFLRFYDDPDLVPSASGLYAGPMGVGQTFRLYGRGHFHWRGTGEGVMRYMDDRITAVNFGDLTHVANGVRVCKGDSGAPLYLSGSFGQTLWQFGIFSEMDISSECAKVGGKARAHRLTEDSINRINSWRKSRGIDVCKPHSDDYPDYWLCD